MKLRRIKGYGLVVLGLLCVGVIFPDVVMAPPPVEKPPVIEKEKITPKPQIGPIQISGNVIIPDGRGLGGVKIKIYEERNGSHSWIKDVVTTRTGYYFINLGGEWFSKTLRLIPEYAQFREGENFSPNIESFRVTNPKINKNFRYNGPLPDLACANISAEPRWAEWCVYRLRQTTGGVSFILSISCNSNGLVNFTIFPFKVKIAGKLGNKNEIIRDIPGKNVSSMSPVWNQTVEIPGAKLEDIVIRYVHIDIEDSVVESNELNNTVAGPFPDI